MSKENARELVRIGKSENFTVKYAILTVTTDEVTGKIHVVETEQKCVIGTVSAVKNEETGSTTYTFTAKWNGWHGKLYPTAELAAKVNSEYLLWQIKHGKFALDTYRKFVTEQTGKRTERKNKIQVVESPQTELTTTDFIKA